ncbi:MAG: hypothetical protein OXF85_01875 [Candidatus Saccharibacteria bacterium]|nr:hypothetical protein [Candidatus Saccharibacteria bacterium]
MEIDPIKRLLALIVYIGAFLAIPFMAKRFGGLLGQLTGTINDRSKGLIDRPRNRLREFGKNRMKNKGIARGIRRQHQLMAGTASPLQKLVHKAGGELKRLEQGGRFRDQKNIHDWRTRRRQRRQEASPGSRREKRHNRADGRSQARNMVDQIHLQEEAQQLAASTYNVDASQLENIATSTKATRAQSLAAVNELMRRGETSIIRNMVQSTAHPENTAARQTLADAMTSEKWRESLLESDPDLATASRQQDGSVRLGTDILFQLPEIHSQKWSRGAWENALNSDPHPSTRMRDRAQSIVDLPVARVNLKPEVTELFASRGINSKAP